MRTLFLFFALSPLVAGAQTTYNLLAPLGPLSGAVTLGDYLSGMVQVIIGLAGILAVVMIVICGIRLIGSPSAGQKEESKKCITNAIFGVILAISSWLILNTINAQLLQSDFALGALPTPVASAPSAPPTTGTYLWAAGGVCAPSAGQIVSTVPPTYCGVGGGAGSVCCGYVSSPIPPPPMAPFPPAPPTGFNPFLPPSTPSNPIIVPPPNPGGVLPPPSPVTPTPPGTPTDPGTPLDPLPPPDPGTDPTTPIDPNFDTLIPEIVIARPFVSGYIVTNGVLSMLYSATDDALASVKIEIASLAGTVLRTVSVCSTLAIPCPATTLSDTEELSLAGLPDGKYNIRVHACDASGNCDSIAREVTNMLGCTATDPRCNTDQNALMFCAGQPITGSCARADLSGDGVVNSIDLSILFEAQKFDINKDGVVDPTTLATNFNDRCFFYTAQDPLLPCALRILGDITITATDKAGFDSMFDASMNGPSSVNIALLNTNLCRVFPCTTPGMGLGNTQHLSVYGEAMFSTLASYDFDGNGTLDWSDGSGDMNYLKACLTRPSDPLCKRADINRDQYLTESDMWMLSNLGLSWQNTTSLLSDMELSFWDGIFQPEAGILSVCGRAVAPLVLLCKAADFNESGRVDAADMTFLRTASRYDINGDGRIIYNSTPLNPVLITATTPTTPSTLFTIGGRIQAKDNVILRSVPGTAQTFVGNIVIGGQGAIVDGPRFLDGNWWWRVTSDTGFTGWTIESLLMTPSAPPPPPPPPPASGRSTKFKLNEEVGSTANLTIRATAASSGTFVGMIPASTTRGVITGNPVLADGFWWWPVSWTSGLTGWSAENWMKEYTPPPAPSITLPRNNTYASTSIVTVRGTMPATEVDGTVALWESTPLSKLGTGIIGTAGGWEVTTSYPDGTHTIIGVATDQSENVGPTSTAITFIVDTIPPSAPLFTGPSALVTVPTVTLSGTVSERSTVYVHNGSLTGPLIATLSTTGATNAWNHTLTNVPNGTHTYVAYARDLAGNVGPASTRVVAVASPPPTPRITSPVANSLTRNTTITISGSGTTVGSTIHLFDGTVEIGTAVIATGRTWSYTGTFTHGTHVLSAHETDIAGVSSARSTNTLFTIDAVAPGAPTVTAPLSMVTTSSYTLTGNTTEASTIRVYNTTTSGALLGTVSTTGTTHAWSLLRSGVTTGTYPLALTATDPAGNVSAVTTFIVSAVLPTPAPIITSPITGSAFTQSAVTVTGTGLGVGNTITLLNNGTPVGTALIDALGGWSIPLVLGSGAHVFTATETTIVGQVSPVSVPVSITVTLGPPAPQITAPLGTLTTNVSSVTFTGQGSTPGNAISLNAGGAIMSTATVLPDLTWSTAVNLLDGTRVFSATEIDTLGQPSPPSASVTVTVDTAMPGAPTLLSPVSGGATPALGATFSGKGTEVGNIVWLFISGLRTISAIVDSGLNWTMIGNISPPGTYIFEVSEQDPAGNEGPRSPGVTVTAT